MPWLDEYSAWQDAQADHECDLPDQALTIEDCGRRWVCPECNILYVVIVSQHATGLEFEHVGPYEVEA